jgi:metal-responsive CopG/Arc/MetJ family transcriptional regulator
MPQAEKIRICLVLPRRTLAKFDRTASRVGRSRSNAVSRAMEHWIAINDSQTSASPLKEPSP